MLTTLRETGLADNTLVIFTSDNGPHNESNHDITRFQPAGPPGASTQSDRRRDSRALHRLVAGHH